MPATVTRTVRSGYTVDRELWDQFADALHIMSCKGENSAIVTRSLEKNGPVISVVFCAHGKAAEEIAPQIQKIMEQWDKEKS